MMGNSENLVNTKEATNPKAEALNKFKQEIDGLELPALKEQKELLEEKLELINQITYKKRSENEIANALGDGIE